MSSYRRLGRVIPAGAVAAVLVLSGCSQGSSDDSAGSGSDGFYSVDDCTDPAAATEEITGDIKVGYSLPLSGPVAGPAAISTAGYDARIKAYNEAGGLDGQKIEVVYKDDAFAPDKAKSNAVDLIQNDKVHVLSTFGGGQVAAMADEQNAACVPMLYPSASNPLTYVIDDYPWTVQFLPESTREADFVLQAIQKKMGDKDFTLGLAVNQTASGEINAESFTKVAEKAGVEIAIEVPATDPTVAATQLKEAGVDVVYHVGLTGTCAPLNGAMARLGYEPEFVILPANCANKAEWSAVGEAGEGAVVPLFLKNANDPGAADDEGLQEYKKQTEGIASSTDAVTAAGWAMADMLIATIEQAAASDDGLTKASMIEAARNLDYTSPMFLDGISWVSTPDKLTGLSGFESGVWSVEAGAFVPEGGVIQVD